MSVRRSQLHSFPGHHRLRQCLLFLNEGEHSRLSERRGGRVFPWKDPVHWSSTMASHRLFSLNDLSPFVIFPSRERGEMGRFQSHLTHFTSHLQATVCYGRSVLDLVNESESHSVSSFIDPLGAAGGGVVSTVSSFAHGALLCSQSCCLNTSPLFFYF